MGEVAAEFALGRRRSDSHCKLQRMTPPKPCPFCILPVERVVQRNASGMLVCGKFPISLGRSLIIPHDMYSETQRNLLKGWAVLSMFVWTTS